MRKVIVPGYGAPDVLRLEEVPTPAPAPGEIRIAVTAAGVNFADVLARMGLYPDAPKPPMVVGYEVAGTVDAVGTGVTAFREGDRVVALTRFGGYASHVVTPATLAYPAPASLTPIQAAALPVTYLTAIIALYRLANLEAGDTVLVHGAGGGVGIAATQLARLRGATVIGTASAAKHEAVRAFGATHLIDYRTADVGEEVRRLTNGRGVDVVLDSLGGRSFAASYRMLAPLGRLVIYGVSSIAPGQKRSVLQAIRTVLTMPSFKPLSLMNRNRGVFGLNMGHLWDERDRLAASMELVLREVEAGRIVPVVSATFPLEQTADAHRYLQARANIGKVVLTV
ncbi:MAG: medium chain dehydrogenase/reductase family protein [Vicinamibacterales bacterium]